MKPVWNILFVQNTRWVVGLSEGDQAALHEVAIDGQAPFSAEAAVTAVRKVIDAQGAVPGPLVLALPSSECLAATVSLDGLMRKQRYEGMLYRLEEQLPVDAEQLTADFVAYGGAAMGVATRHARLGPIVDALEESGIDVAHICPTALLIHESLRQTAPTQTTETLRCDILATDRTTIDLIFVRGEELLAWRSVTAVASLVRTELEQTSLHLGASPETLETHFALRLDEWITSGSDATKPPGEAVDAAFLPVVLEASTNLGEGIRPVVDLRRGALAGRSIWTRVTAAAYAAALALGLFLLMIGAVATHWGNSAAQQSRIADREQASLFREVFPNQAIPAAPVSRFRSEAAKAKGTTGTGDHVPQPGVALKDLFDVLEGLPASGEMRFRLLETRIESDRIYLSGQARSHADTDRVVGGLRKTVDFSLDPPRTQNLTGASGQGVSFTLGGYRETSRP